MQTDDTEMRLSNIHLQVDDADAPECDPGEEVSADWNSEDIIENIFFFPNTRDKLKIDPYGIVLLLNV